MKNIWQLFTADLKAIKSNVISLIVVIGLLLTPALYAWFNILGFWDPYSATDNLEVAVTNTDAGYSSDLFPSTINAGEQVISALRADHEFKWVFTDRAAAVDGVESGQYYAAIVIPEQFSADLLSIFSGNIEHADIIYYTNQKENAVAPKVTAVGATNLSVAINQAFTKSVASVALDTTSSLMSFVSGDGVATYGRNLTQNLSQAISDLGQAQTEATAFADLIDATSGVASTASDILHSLGATATSVTPFLDQIEAGVNDGSSALGAARADLEGLLGQIDGLSSQIDQKFAKIEQKLEPLVDASTSSEISPEDAKQKLEELQKLHSELQGKLETAKTTITSYQDQLASKNAALLDSLQGVKNTILSVNANLQDITQRLADVSGSLASNLSVTGGSLRETATTLQGAAARLTDTRDQLAAALSSHDYAKLREIIGSNPEGIADFISSPTVLNTIPVYGMANNGSAFSPFYTSLAIWVGTVFMVALMETEVGKKRLAAIQNPRPYQLYWGRYLTFLTFALIQATIVCLGDVFFLGIQCDNIGLFFLTGWACALVFSSIVYTLTLTFGKVGECLSIILLVMQIAASGGIFPVVLSADFFQALYPFLPFTYSLQAFQGAVAGVYGNQEIVSLLMMLAFIPPMLLIGLGVRPLISKGNDYFSRKLAETKIM